MCYPAFRWRLLLPVLGLAFSFEVLAQTPGLIYKPAGTTLGRSVLDPNGDGYISTTAAGFSGTDYGSASELDMVPFPIITPEPLGDLTTGSAGGSTDIVTATGKQSCYILYRVVSGTPYLVFRFRLGGASTSSKGYSFLIDTDGVYSGTGSNPGYEKEVVMATGSNGTVSILSYDNAGNTTSRIDYDIDAYSQRSVALSTLGGNPDFFYDFFVPYSGLGVGSQAVRIVPVTITSSGFGLTGVKGDFNGVNDAAYRNNPEAIMRDLVNAFPPTVLTTLTPGSTFPDPRSLAPVVNSGITVASTSIGGTSREAAGTTITIYRNGNPLGTAFVDANGNWALTGVSGLLAGNFITADALASGKTRSPLSGPVQVTQVQTCYLPTPTIVSDQPSGNKNFVVTWTWPAGMDPAANPIKIRVYSVSPAGVFTLVNGAQDLIHIGNGKGSCTYLVGVAGNISGSYVATAASATCTSGYGNTYNTGDGGNKNVVTTAPSITNAYLLANTGSTDIIVTNLHPSAATLYLYVNGVQVAFATGVAGGTTRTFSYTGLIDGDVVQARADGSGTLEVISNLSNTLVVQASLQPTTPPVITGTYVSGATSVSGTSIEAAGTIINLYKADTVLLGTTTVNAFGTWTVTGLLLAAGDVLTARAKAYGKTISLPSAGKTVAASIPSAPSISGGYNYLSSEVTGTDGNGTVTVYVDGSPIGTTTGSSWTLSSIPSGQLYRGAVITATNTVGGVEGPASAGVTVTGVASFLVTATDGGAITTQTAGVPFDVRITAKDGPSGGGNTFTSFTGRVTVTSSSVVLSGGGVTAPFTGGVLSPHSLSLRTAGTDKTITVVSVDDPTATGTAIVALVKPNVTYRLLLTKPADIAAGTRAAYNVARQDAYDNPTTSGSIDVYLTGTGSSSLFYNASSGGIAVQSVVIPLGMSSAEFWFTDTVASSYRITASDASPADGDAGLIDALDTLAVVAGPADRFAMDAPAYIRITGSNTLSAQLTDQYGNPVSTSGMTVQWNSSPPGNTSYFPAPGTSTTNASGVSTISFTPPGDAPTDVLYTFTATSGSYIGTFQSTVVIGKVWHGRMNDQSNVSGNWQDDALPQEGDNLYYDPEPVNPLVLQEPLVFSKIHFRGSDADHRIILNGKKLIVRGSIELNGFTGRIKANGPMDELELGGNGTQTVPANVFESDEVRDLKLNNPNGIALAGRLIVKGTITPVAGTLTTNGHLILRSDSAGTARVAQGNGNYISGQVVAERYVRKNANVDGTGRAWRLVSVPVTGTGTLRDWFMNGRSGHDLTIPSNRDAESANSGAPIVGHIYATAGEATAAGFDWIGVPFQFSSLRHYSGNPTGGGFNSSQVPDLSTTFDASDQGYMVFVRGDRKLVFPSTSNSNATTLRTVGELKKGDQRVSVAPASTAMYTLVGNPYMSVLDLDAFYHANSAAIKPSFMLWDANIPGSQKQGSYVTVAKSGSAWVTNLGTYTDPQLLESGSAFFVQPVDGLTASADVTIRETHKSNGSSAGLMPFSTSADDGHGRVFVRLERSDATGRKGIVDGVLLDFHESHSEALSDALDIDKMRNEIGIGSLWLVNGKRTLSMQGLPWPPRDSSRTVALHMTGLGSQSMTLTIDPRNLARPGFRVWLRDRVLGKQKEIGLTGTVEYAFTPSGVASKDSLRFELVFSEEPKPATQFFKAKAFKSGTSVDLEWQVSEGAATRFVVERSADRESFKSLDTLPANDNAGGFYRWQDRSPLKGVGYYRIRAVDEFGQTNVSPILRVDMGVGEGVWRMYPNPASSSPLKLSLEAVPSGRYQVTLLDNTGRRLKENVIDHAGGDGAHAFILPPSLNAGLYMLHVERGGRHVAAFRLVWE